MQTQRVILKGEEQRKYKRLRAVLPVEFTIVRLQGDLLPGIDWQKGSTVNVSKGGMCLEVRNINKATIGYLSRQDIYFEMKIQLPNGAKTVKAVGELCWYQNNHKVMPTYYILGLKWRSITKENLKLILSQVERSKVLMYIGSLVAAGLFIIFILYLFNSKMSY